MEGGKEGVGNKDFIVAPQTNDLNCELIEWNYC